MSLFFTGFVVVLLGYLLGCFNGAMLISHHFMGDDVRSHGSGNAGLSNFYRTYGARYAALVVVCDMGKTAAATLIGGPMFDVLFGDWTLGVLLGAAGCILGHVFPIFYAFRGGKGILSGGMLLIILDWRVALIGWGLFLILVLCTRYISLGSIAGAISLPVSVFFIYDHNPTYTILCVLMVALILYSHRSNIQRLLNGTERKFQRHKPSSDPSREKENEHGKEN